VDHAGFKAGELDRCRADDLVHLVQGPVERDVGGDVADLQQHTVGCGRNGQVLHGDAGTRESAEHGGAMQLRAPIPGGNVVGHVIDLRCRWPRPGVVHAAAGALRFVRWRLSSH